GGAEAGRARPAAAGLRPGLQGLARLQPAGRAARHRRHRAAALHPARAHALARGGRGLPRAARETRLPRPARDGGGGMSTAPLLIELGTEELPVKALPGLAQALADGVVAGLDRRGIGHGAARALYTPRRLAVVVDAVATAQPEQRSERRGPA